MNGFIVAGLAVACRLAAPRGRVGGATLVADFKVETVLTQAATVAKGGDGFTAAHPVTFTAKQALVVGVEAEVVVAVVDNNQQAGSAQPVGVDYTAIVNGAYRVAFSPGNLNALPANGAALAGRAKAVETVDRNLCQSTSSQMLRG